jgi:hypothetical protein
MCKIYRLNDELAKMQLRLSKLEGDCRQKSEELNRVKKMLNEAEAEKMVR